MENLYNMHIKPRAFRAGDLVQRIESRADPMARKFQLNWEGQYVIIRMGLANSYALNKLDGASVLRMWNVMHLKRYYQ